MRIRVVGGTSTGALARGASFSADGAVENASGAGESGATRADSTGDGGATGGGGADGRAQPVASNRPKQGGNCLIDSKVIPAE